MWLGWNTEIWMDVLLKKNLQKKQQTSLCLPVNLSTHTHTHRCPHLFATWKFSLTCLYHSVCQPVHHCWHQRLVQPRHSSPDNLHSSYPGTSAMSATHLWNRYTAREHPQISELTLHTHTHTHTKIMKGLVSILVMVLVFHFLCDGIKVLGDQLSAFLFHTKGWIFSSLKAIQIDEFS